MGSARTDFGGPSITLLVAGDECPATVANESGKSPFLLLGDHAGIAIPQTFGDLGVSSSDMARHIACDIGIAGLGIRLSERLDATFIRQHYSRLVIDCNRVPGTPGSIAPMSDGTLVPGNADLSPAQVEARRGEIYQPYQDRITAEIVARAERGQATVLVSLHSFTPVMAGFVRPWRCGVLHRGDSAFSDAVLALMREDLGEAAGDNEPYKMDGTDNTIPLHADGHGLDYLEVEVRQDLIAEASGQEAMAAWLAGLLPRALERASSQPR